MINNKVTLAGAITTGFTLDHSYYSESFYRFTLSVKRDSGTVDNIPVIVSERLIDVSKDMIGQYVFLDGVFRSYNLHEDLKTRLILYIFANDIELLDHSEEINDVFLEGLICKPPVHRVTPLGREITDLLLVVSRAYGKCDYIPAVAWSRSAKFISGLPVGDRIRLAGRVQSREYSKGNEVKTAYELSVNLVEEC